MMANEMTHPRYPEYEIAQERSSLAQEGKYQVRLKKTKELLFTAYSPNVVETLIKLHATRKESLYNTAILRATLGDARVDTLLLNLDRIAGMP